jgi:RNA polymerase sigma factor (sigma-70 family)
MDPDDLQSIGTLAILKSGTEDEALAVRVAKCAILNALDANTVRERGRVEVRKGHHFELNGDDVSFGEALDRTVWDGSGYFDFGLSEIREYDMHQKVVQAMHGMPEGEFIALTLYFWSGWTQARIAAELGISQRAVSKRIDSAKKHIREVLKRRP